MQLRVINGGAASPKLVLRARASDKVFASDSPVSLISQDSKGKSLVESIVTAISAVEGVKHTSDPFSTGYSALLKLAGKIQSALKKDTNGRAADSGEQLLFAVVCLTEGSFSIIPVNNEKNAAKILKVDFCNSFPSVEGILSSKVGFFPWSKKVYLFSQEEFNLLLVSILKTMGNSAHLVEFGIDAASIFENCTAKKVLNVAPFFAMPHNPHLGVALLDNSNNPTGLITGVPGSVHPSLNSITFLDAKKVEGLIHAMRARRKIIASEFKMEAHNFLPTGQLINSALGDIKKSLELYPNCSTALQLFANIIAINRVAWHDSSGQNPLLHSILELMNIRISLYSHMGSDPSNAISITPYIASLGEDLNSGLLKIVSGDTSLTMLEGAYLFGIAKSFGVTTSVTS